MSTSRPILLIDADVLRYRVAYSNTRKIDWGDGGAASVAVQPDRARARLHDAVEELVGKFKARDFVLALSCKAANFRKELDHTYKHGRSEKPELWHTIDEEMRAAWGKKIVEIPRLEGDDVLGLLGTHPNPARAPGSRIVVSLDKDLRTVPGIRLYNPDKPNLGVTHIDPHSADLFWMHQTLTGDVTDNYPGLPGVGHKTADEILLPIHEEYREASVEEHLYRLWAAVVETYTTRTPRGGKAPLTEAHAIHQARLARILRYGDYKPKTKEIVLWKPS